MTENIIIVTCVLLLIAYFFDLTASKTKVPSVVLLLLLGYGVRQLMKYFNMELPDFSTLLPVLGTLGLILIVLEGALELELNKSKMPIIKLTLLGAVIPLVILAFILTYFFAHNYGGRLMYNLINAIPFCVISSAIAIPAMANAEASRREFVIYESSLSDITGILFFNFLIYNEVIGPMAFGSFLLQCLVMLLIAVVGTASLAYLLNRIDHHIKFIPIILLVILIYCIAKDFHLPALLFVLIFGLFAGNINLFKKVPVIKRISTEAFSREIEKMKELNIEMAFLIRSLFFLLFGFVIRTSELFNAETFVLALSIVLLVVAIRVIQLKLSKLPLVPLLFIAPRGLITVLLFLSITPEQSVPFVNQSLVIQVVVLSAFLMMIGLMLDKKTAETKN